MSGPSNSNSNYGLASASGYPRGMDAREHAKFRESPADSGEVAVAVVASDGEPFVPVTLEGHLQAQNVILRQILVQLQLLTGTEVGPEATSL